MSVLTRPFPRTAASGADAGMTTAEYALCTVTAVAFAGVLYAVVTSGGVREALTNLVVNALSTGL
ncbi:DUF4244 domain-containing protein [Nocardiopsis sp. ATB16-24]|uniref:DUF4244 domain-containing protein n=1 Tax=Nocardiopsis sp. ATB16-24 TaxID=3019555 RepID=UPI0025528D1A|nr:DUF4244 domain-containing protein [Nocardiopsis sp. ATB16-24]